MGAGYFSHRWMAGRRGSQPADRAGDSATGVLGSAAAFARSSSGRDAGSVTLGGTDERAMGGSNGTGASREHSCRGAGAYSRSHSGGIGAIGGSAADDGGEGGTAIGASRRTGTRACASSRTIASRGTIAGGGAAPEAAPAKQQSVMDSGMSRTLTDYLHHQRLPFVAATVYAQGGTPRSILLSGQVRTQKGKDDAETKSRAFLGVRGVAVHNRVRINPALALSPSTSGYADAGAGPPAGGNSCSEVCQSNEGQCEGNCRNQSAGNSGGLGGALSSLLGQMNQGGQCAQNCRQMMNQCMGSCGAGGSGSRY